MRHPDYIIIIIVTLLAFAHFPSTSPAIADSSKQYEKFISSKSRRRQYPETCKAGKVYRITQVQDLFDNYSDLECIFRAAEEPDKVPEGPLYGEVFSLANVRVLNPLMRTVWTGKFTKKVVCNGNETYLGWNRILEDAHFPFVAYLGKLPEVSNPHPLYNDNKTSLMIDYTRAMDEICPDFLEMKARSSDSLPVQRSPVNKNFFPVTAILDVVRLVGRQEDGGAIYLGQLFWKDHFATDEMAKPCLFFSLVSYDPDVNRNFKSGQALKPLESVFHYRHQNLLDTFMILNPLDNLLTEPIHTVTKTAKEFLVSGRNMGYFLWDLGSGIGSQDSRRLTHIFKSNLPKRNDTDESSQSSKFISKHENVHSHVNEL